MSVWVHCREVDPATECLHRVKDWENNEDGSLSCRCGYQFKHVRGWTPSPLPTGIFAFEGSMPTGQRFAVEADNIDIPTFLRRPRS